MPGFGAELGMAAAGQATGNFINEAMGLITQPIKNKQQLKQAQKLQWMQEEGAVRLGDYNYGKQLEMWKATNAPAQVAMLKEAGLNPALLYGSKGGGGATTGSGGGSVSGQSAGTATPSRGAEGMGIQVALLEAQRENIEADTRLKNVDANKKEGVDTDLTKAQTLDLLQGVENKKAQEELTKIQTKLTGLEATFQEKSMDDRLDIVDSEGAKLIKELDILGDQYDILHTTRETQKEQIRQYLAKTKMEIAVLASAGAKNWNDIEVGKSQIKLNAAQVEKVKAEISKWTQETMQEWFRLGQEGAKINLQDMQLQFQRLQQVLNTITGPNNPLDITGKAKELIIRSEGLK